MPPAGPVRGCLAHSQRGPNFLSPHEICQGRVIRGASGDGSAAGKAGSPGLVGSLPLPKGTPTCEQSVLAKPELGVP